MEKGRKPFTVSDLPVDERPRERLLNLGPEFLSAQELLAIIIGKGVKGMSVTTVSQILLSRFGSLLNICEASVGELTNVVKGIGPAKIAQIKACFEIARRIEHEKNNAIASISKKPKITSPDVAYHIIRRHLVSYKKEHFFVLCLDLRNRLLAMDDISKGTLESAVVHPRETFELAIEHHAGRIIIAHNHPSEDPNPSEDDINITNRLKQAGLIMGIDVIDHLIVCRKS
ncbi:MAG TPA: DNA repair protein RadC, partial [bacterium]|nr:DNA repair protein RadC [bacterium]